MLMDSLDNPVNGAKVRITSICLLYRVVGLTGNLLSMYKQIFDALGDVRANEGAQTERRYVSLSEICYGKDEWLIV